MVLQMLLLSRDLLTWLYVILSERIKALLRIKAYNMRLIAPNLVQVNFYVSY